MKISQFVFIALTVGIGTPLRLHGGAELCQDDNGYWYWEASIDTIYAYDKPNCRADSESSIGHEIDPRTVATVTPISNVKSMRWEKDQYSEGYHVFMKINSITSPIECQIVITDSNYMFDNREGSTCTLFREGVSLDYYSWHPNIPWTHAYRLGGISGDDDFTIWPCEYLFEDNDWVDRMRYGYSPGLEFRISIQKNTGALNIYVGDEESFVKRSGFFNGATITIPSQMLGHQIKSFYNFPFPTNRIWTLNLGSSIRSIDLDPAHVGKLIINSEDLDSCCLYSDLAFSFDSLENYSDYDKLREIHIPHLTNIVDRAFANLKMLEKIEASNHLKHIGAYAFRDCVNLKSLYFGNSLMTIGECAFLNCESIESVSLKGVERVAKSAFAGCCGLKELVIPECVYFDGTHAFSRCSGLKKLKIEYRETYEEGMTNLFCSANMTPYLGITELNTGLIPYGIIEEGVEKLIVPEGVKSGGERLFAPKGVKKIELPASLNDVTNLVKGGVEYLVSSDNPKFLNDLNYSLRSNGGIDMLAWSNKSSQWSPSAVGETSAFVKPTKRIGDKAFQNCDKLRYVTLDTNVTQIGKAAFKGLENLSCVSFASNLTSIGESAFEDCPALRFVNAFPVTLKSLGKRAFANCPNVNGYTFEGKAPSCAGKNAADFAFANGPDEKYCNVYYYSKYRTSWTNAIHDAYNYGLWQGRVLTELTGVPIKHKVFLAAQLQREVDDYVHELGLDGSDVSVDLAEGMTEEGVNTAYLLGVSPSVAIEDGVAALTSDSSFKVSTFDIDHDNNTAMIEVEVSTESGCLPDDYNVKGLFDISVCDSLGGEWTDLDIGDQFTTTRRDGKSATLSATVDLSGHKFFRATVK